MFVFINEFYENLNLTDFFSFMYRFNVLSELSPVTEPSVGWRRETARDIFGLVCGGHHCSTRPLCPIQGQKMLQTQGKSPHSNWVQFFGLDNDTSISKSIYFQYGCQVPASVFCLLLSKLSQMLRAYQMKNCSRKYNFLKQWSFPGQINHSRFSRLENTVICIVCRYL